MEFKSLEVKNYPEMLKLYDESFPEDERRIYRNAEHFESFVKEKGAKFHGFAAEDGGVFTAFLTYWTFKGYVYVEHFAVVPEKRGRNIGRLMLEHLFRTVGEDVLLEVEKPETDEARRRIAFYEKCGFRLREDINYVQPPYSEGQKSLPMMLMTHGDVKLRDTADLREMLTEVYNVNAGI